MLIKKESFIFLKSQDGLVGMKLPSSCSRDPPTRPGMSEWDFPCWLCPAKPHLLAIGAALILCHPCPASSASCASGSWGCWWCFLFVLCPPVERDGSGAGRARAQVRQGPEREPRGAEVHRVRAASVPAVHHRCLQGTGEALPSSCSLLGTASHWLGLQLLGILSFSHHRLQG